MFASKQVAKLAPNVLLRRDDLLVSQRFTHVSFVSIDAQAHVRTVNSSCKDLHTSPVEVRVRTVNSSCGDLHYAVIEAADLADAYVRTVNSSCGDLHDESVPLRFHSIESGRSTRPAEIYMDGARRSTSHCV